MLGHIQRILPASKQSVRQFSTTSNNSREMFRSFLFFGAGALYGLISWHRDYHTSRPILMKLDALDEKIAKLEEKKQTNKQTREDEKKMRDKIEHTF